MNAVDTGNHFHKRHFVYLSPLKKSRGGDIPAKINLIFDGSDTAQQIKPDLHHYPSGMDSRSLLGYRHHDEYKTSSPQQDEEQNHTYSVLPYLPVDERKNGKYQERVNRIHHWTIRERLIATAFLLILAILSFVYWQIL